MELRTVRKTIQLNPQLEALRTKALEESSSESKDWILHLINRTQNIHAGFLFEDRKTLQKLCLFISETQNKITDAGWEAFGFHLGLSPSVLKVINYNNFNKEDPCYNTLLAYVQLENASVGRVMEALYKMGRIDVLSRIRESVNELADIIVECNGNYINHNSVEDTSDYESLSTFEGYSQNINIAPTSDSTSTEILVKPKVIPPAPFIFQNLQANCELTSQQIQQALCNAVTNSLPSYEEREQCKNIQNINEKITCVDVFPERHEANLMVDTLQNQSLTKSNKEKYTATRNKKYGIKILLTFAEDGEKHVEEICKIFRKKREDFPAIGVLVLNEHVSNVNKDPLQFISGAFSQVDYVCPVLTTGYFNLITKKQKATSLSNMHIDSLYVPYIYRLMNSYFISNDCLNDKVRCIIPEDEFSLIPFKFLWTNPIFGAWVKLSEVDELALRLLKSK